MVLCLTAPAMGLGADLDTFRLTRLGGSLELDYSVEDQEVSRVEGDTTSNQRTISEQILKLEANGYMYHPNLLDMKLGMGVRFKNDEFERDRGATTESKRTLYSFDGKFNFLKQKSYPFSLFYSQSNPTTTTGLGDKITTENQTYGLALSLKQPLVTFPMWLRTLHIETTGDGGGTTINSESDFEELRMSTRGLDNFHGNFSIDHSRKRSGSGSLNLPIQATLNERFRYHYDGTARFGEKQQHEFYSLLSYETEEFKGIAKSATGRFDADLRLEHEAGYSSRYKYNIEDTSSDSGSDSTNQALTAGISGPIAEGLTFSSELGATDGQAEGFDQNSYSTRNSILYGTELSEQIRFGSSYSLNYDRRNQESELRHRSITGEDHRLENLQPVVLVNEYVVPGSVVVSNEDRTQTYVEGLDYSLTVVGTETRLEPLLSGNIADGETVLVDYGYETGGTYGTSILAQSLSGNLSLFRNYRFRIYHSKREETLEEGRPLRPLYSTERTSVSAEGQHRPSSRTAFSWNLAAEKESGSLNPNTRKVAGINFRFVLPFIRGFASISSRYENQENELSEEDVNLTSHSLGIGARTGLHSWASLSYITDKDTGGTITRKTDQARLNYKWRWRLLSFNLEGKYKLQEQGDASREDSSVMLSLVRRL